MLEMPDPTLEISAASIVLIGAFNPRIFHPEWFARRKLLPQTEADQANIAIIHPQVCQFQTERFHFQVTLDRLVIGTKPNAVPEPLRDLIEGTFYILEHTPVSAMGLNRDMHFAMHSEEAWHLVGDKLAPKEPWQEFSYGRRPGVRDLQILYGARSPEESSTTVTVQPSVQVQHGIFFQINDTFTTNDNDNGLKFLMGALKTRWEESQKNADRIAQHILRWAAAQD
jgi:hypothetical protein